jgi:hypothetical protein
MLKGFILKEEFSTSVVMVHCAGMPGIAAAVCAVVRAALTSLATAAA